MNTPSRPVEILVVDDSAVVRQAVKAILEEERPAYRVLLARDPYEAVDVLAKSVPAAIVLDVEMPRMDGLTFLKKLMRQHPLPVLICTDHVDRGLTGLEIGARGVVGKPDWADPADLADWGLRLRDHLGSIIGAPTPRPEVRSLPGSRLTADVILPRRAGPPRGGPGEKLVVVGASTGGVQAIGRLLADLPPDAPGVVIVQHMPPTFTARFAERLDADPGIRVRVIEAKSNEPVREGTALVVPGDLHGLIRRNGSGYRVELIDGPKVAGHRPSVDVIFRSAAQAAGHHAAGVLLTGMLTDGAAGLLEMREAGALTVAQDQATSLVFGMPREAIRLGAAALVLPLPRIAAAVMTWAAESR